MLSWAVFAGILVYYIDSVLFTHYLLITSYYATIFRSALCERMPVLDESTYSVRRAGSLPAAASSLQGSAVTLSNGVAKPNATPLVDLLDLSSDDAPVPSSSGSDFLHDLLGDLSSDIPHAGWCQIYIPGITLFCVVMFPKVGHVLENRAPEFLFFPSVINLICLCLSKILF